MYQVAIRGQNSMDIKIDYCIEHFRCVGKIYESFDYSTRKKKFVKYRIFHRQSMDAQLKKPP